MEKYSEYKDSGVEWLGEIPSHWRLLPGKSLFYENKRKNDGQKHNILSLSYGNIVIKQNVNEGLVPENYTNYQLIEHGNIVVRCTDLQNDKISLRTAISEYKGIITSAYLALIPNGNIVPKYLHYLLRNWDNTKELYRYGSGLRQSLSWLDFKNLQIPIPSLSEQQTIATYLDSQTSKIDEAIAQQQKMIDLLNERKQIIINNAVTKGLDPNVPMKETGIQWLGKIPSSWNILPGKSLFRENKEKNDGKPHNILSLSYGNIVIKQNINEGLVPENYSNYQLIKEGYVVIRCTDLQNDKVSLRTASSKYVGIITNAYLALIPNNIIVPQYLHYLLRTWDITKELYRYGSGLRQSLSWSDFKNLQLPIPPLVEQELIATYLDEQISQIDNAIVQQHKMSKFLQERKQIIINEVVTGKVKVS